MDQRKCPDCWTDVPSTAIECPKCGRSMVPVDPSETAGLVFRLIVWALAVLMAFGLLGLWLLIKKLLS
ncbi:MAG: hypothetical protein NTW86_00620 [Candidatus Sumerlaeota bacterium]|nr:hypothetical protein [Candidatus Sumerlaeota bacterium]